MAYTLATTNTYSTKSYAMQNGTVTADAGVLPQSVTITPPTGAGTLVGFILSPTTLAGTAAIGYKFVAATGVLTFTAGVANTDVINWVAFYTS